MDLQPIRQLITAARRREHSSGRMLQRLQTLLPELERRLVLPADNAAATLLQFIEVYIEQVPLFLEELASAETAPLTADYVAPFLNMAEDFFLAPPTEITADTGLEVLLDEAFLAQRLLEEVNDRAISLCGQPLLAVDMTRANIIVHHLIGDELANRLDMLVEQSVALLIAPRRLFEESLTDKRPPCSPCGWRELPCLSRDYQVDLKLAPGPATADQSSED